jgi:hypothetical protein
MVLGALTVVPSFLLGREIAGPNVGIIAGLLVATGSAHIAVNSHIAWSNCLTPLFTTACFWLLARSERRRSGLALAGAGLIFGLALQTHPAVVAFAPSIAVFVLWRCRRAVSWVWMALAAAAFLVGYANMVAYNVSTNLDSLRSAQRVSGEYATADDADAGWQVVSSMLLLLARLAGGAVDQRTTALSYLLDPGVIVSLIFAAIGLVVVWRRGDPLPLLAAVMFLALLPLVNTKFRTLITIRYLMPVYPLLALGVAITVVNVAHRLGTRSVRLGLAVALLALVATIAPALLSLQRHYDRLLRATDTNERILRIRDAIHQTRRPDELVIVDEDMGSEIAGTGVTEIRGFRYLLTMDDIPFRSERISGGRLEDAAEAAPSVLAVLNGRDLEQAERRLKVQPLEARERAVIGRGSDYQLYRLEQQ